MSRVTKTRGICLARRDFRESSRIATFLSPDFGRLSLLARGARRPKSKFGASLEIFTLASLVFYRREHKDLYTLSETEIAEDFPELRTSPRLELASAAVEFAAQTTVSEAGTQPLFELLLEVLHTLCRHEGTRARGTLFGFLLKAAALLGYRPALDRCLVCKKSVTTGRLGLERGGVVCAECAPGFGRSDEADLPLLRALLDRPLGRAAMPLDARPTEDTILAYLKYHFDRLDLRSLK